ncbi:MAG TPA: hypothetical protein VMW85_04325 [Methanomassiliicoccales archaeon]|nr:hypothetical protein [Methanomassiliicoccales archaeon]
MKVLGLCAFCSKPTSQSCPMCGRPVCSEHLDPHNHICQGCSRDLSEVRKRDGPLDKHLLR